LGWTYDEFWNKSRLYIQKAYAADRESAEFGLNTSLALEFLARATVAFLHPALLADPRGNDHLLYAFGINTTDKPKSVDISTVLLRIKKIKPEFTEDMASFCQTHVERRNSELHSGELAFEGLPTATWLASYFRSVTPMLEYQNKSLADLLSDLDEVKAAEEMIVNLDGKERDRAEKTKSVHRSAFQKIDAGSQAAVRAQASVFASNIGVGQKAVNCPACESPSIVSGRRIRTTEPKLEDGMLRWEEIYLPTQFECTACGMKLVDYPSLEGSNVGGQYASMRSEDPLTYYAPEEQFFEEYDNE